MGDAPWGFGIARASERFVRRSLLEGLCELASQAAGVRFAPHAASSYRELADALERSELGLAWMPPVPIIDLEERGTATPLVVPSREGWTTYHAALIVRRGTQRRSLSELEGLRVAWVQRDSASGYLAPRIHLAAQGFDVFRFFSREVFLANHAEVIDAVASGQVDVGATFCRVDPATGQVAAGGWLDAEGRSKRPVEPLVTIGPIPNDAMIASNELPSSARAGLVRWLLDPDPTTRALFEELVGTSDFRLARSEHYDELRRQLRRARARGYDALPRASRTPFKVR